MKNFDYKVIRKGISDTSEAERGKRIFYRCSICGGIIPSNPKDNVGCQCGNVFIDIDYHRLAVNDYGNFEVLEKMG